MTLPKYPHWHDKPNGEWLVLAEDPQEGWIVYLRTDFEELVVEAEETLNAEGVRAYVVFTADIPQASGVEGEIL